MWGRPTINWKLEGRCGKVPRNIVSDKLDLLNSSMDLNFGFLIKRSRGGVTLFWLGLPLIGLVALFGVIYKNIVRQSFSVIHLIPILIQLAIPVLFAYGVFY